MHLCTDRYRSFLQRMPVLILGFIFCAGTFSLNAESLAGVISGENKTSNSRKVYDLPSGGGKEVETEEEITEVIPLFGTEIYADNLYLCIEHTRGMAGERRSVISAEFDALVNSLSKQARFGAIAFNNQLHHYKNSPVYALSTNKNAAKAWESTIQNQSGFSLAEALRRTLALANQDRFNHRAIALIIDDSYSLGENELDAELVNSQLNTDSLPIHIFFIHGNNPDPDLERSCREISSFSGGQFRNISIAPEPLPLPLPIPPLPLPAPGPMEGCPAPPPPPPPPPPPVCPGD